MDVIAKWTLLNFLLSEVKNGADLTENQIQHFLNNFLINVITTVVYYFTKIRQALFYCALQGHDTISALISWFTYMMATHINHQVRKSIG